MDRLSARDILAAELVDLRDYPMEFMTRRVRPPLGIAIIRRRLQNGRIGWIKLTATSS